MLNSVIGHEKIKADLSARLKKSLTGTYIFHGPNSVGKKTLAVEVAKVALCENVIGEDCSCASCRKIKSDHPDFFLTGNTDSRIKVADIDQFLEFTENVPILSNFKVAIFDNAHSITWSAANRLLKILEEPPSKILIFLVTSDPKALPFTILSRCYSFEFKSLSKEDLTNIIWKKLGFELSDARVLGWIAHDTSVDIFFKAGLYLKYRMMAYDFLTGIRKKPLIDSFDFIDKIDKQDLSIFVDMTMLILTDMLLIKNGLSDVANVDLYDSLKKSCQDYKDKALIAVAGIFSQLKKDLYLNVNLNIFIKNSLIKTYPLFKA